MKHGHKKATHPRIPAETAEDAFLVEELKSRAVELLVAEATPSEQLMQTFADGLRSTASDSVLGELIRRVTEEFQDRALPLLDVMAHGEDARLAKTAIQYLGNIENEQAAVVLEEVAEKTIVKELRKEAKRALYKLKTRGVQVDAILSSREATVEVEKPRYRILSAHISAIDGEGNRVALAAVEKPLGGAALVQVLMNDEFGMKTCRSSDMGVRKLPERLEQERRRLAPIPLLEVPATYLQRLFNEAIAIGTTAGHTVPYAFRPWQNVLAPEDQPMQQPAVYDELSLLEIKWHPELLEESPQLLNHTECGQWLTPKERMAPYLVEMRKIKESKVSLPPWVEKEKMDEVVQRAITSFFDAPTRRRFKRRLEETSYVFLRTGKHTDAKRALAAAQAFDERSEVPITQNPFAKSFVLNGLLVLQVEAEPQESAAARAGLLGISPSLGNYLADSLLQLEEPRAK